MQGRSDQPLEQAQRLLGNYRILRLLGQGSFADVYLGEHIHLHTQAAIKVLQVRLVESNIQSFLNEARTIAHLVHPYIIRVLDFGVEANTPFLVMDYAPQGTFRQRLIPGKPLPPTALFPPIKQAASALQYAHDKKLIHRDVKPENMLLGSKEEILLSDFGFALIQTSVIRPSSETAGTASYMAPEQFRGSPQPASDQYSLGVIAYEWLAGGCPFQGTFMELASQHMFAQPSSLLQRVPGLSAQVAQVVMRALAKEPEERFPTVQDFARELEHACLSANKNGGVSSPMMPPLSPTRTDPSWMGTSLAGASWAGASQAEANWAEGNQAGASWTGGSRTGASQAGASWTGGNRTGASQAGASWTGGNRTGASHVPTGDILGYQRGDETQTRFQVTQNSPERTLSSSFGAFQQEQTPPPLSSSFGALQREQTPQPSVTFLPLQQQRMDQNISEVANTPRFSPLNSAEPSFSPALYRSQPPQPALPELPPLPQEPFLAPELLRQNKQSPMVSQTFPVQQNTGIRVHSPSRNFPILNADSPPRSGLSALNEQQGPQASQRSLPQSTPLVKAEDFRKRPKSSTSGTLRFFVIFMVILIIGSTALLVVLQRNGTKSPSANQQQQSTATATTTPQQITQTPGQNEPNPYGNHNGILILNDPLSQQNQQMQWNESPGICTFSTNSYHVVASRESEGFTICNATATDYINFVYQVQMTFTTETSTTGSGGLVFRGNQAEEQFYFFEIFTTGRYAFYRCPGGNGASCPLLSSSATTTGPIPSFRTTLNQPNTIAVLANGNTFNIYVNNELAVGPIVDTEIDPTYSHGTIGMMARQNSTSAVTDVSFSTIKIWKL